jgi:hypothetical protein
MAQLSQAVAQNVNQSDSRKPAVGVTARQSSLAGYLAERFA